MNEFMKAIKEIIENQTIISFELTRGGASILWSGCIFSAIYDLDGIHLAGDNVELNLKIDDKNVKKDGENFVIENDDFSVFFNIET